MAQKVFSSELVPSLRAYDAIRVSPKDLRPDPVLNGRVELPNIANFKRDFLDPRIGQVQPITIKKVDGLPVIVDGVTRWRAALEITEEGTGPHEGGAFFLKCQYVVAKTPADYFILTIKGNIRNEPKPADDAHNVAILIHNFQFTEERIAGEVYGRFTPDGAPDVSWVRAVNALNDLTPRALEAMKAGRVKSKAAIALAKLTPKEQNAKLELLEPGQKLTVAAIKRAASPQPQESTSDGSVTPPVAPKRKWDRRQFVELIEQYLEMDLPAKIKGLSCENAVRAVLGEILDEINGDAKSTTIG